MKIAITGHTNIEKGNGFSIIGKGETYVKEAYDKTFLEIENELKNIAKDNNIDFEKLVLISGMARGVDEILAHIAIKNNLKLILAIPHTIAWHKNRDISTKGTLVQAIEYNKILNYNNLEKIMEIKKNYREGNHKFANFARNQYMVDECELLISYKKYDSSGTDDCIKRGKLQNKYLGNVGDIKYSKQLEFDFIDDIQEFDKI